MHRIFYIEPVGERDLNQLSNIIGKTGIVVFEVSGWSNAYGHFTLWDGKSLLYAPGHNDENDMSYYFWLVSFNGNKIIQTRNILFWELK